MSVGLPRYAIKMNQPRQHILFYWTKRFIDSEEADAVMATEKVRITKIQRRGSRGKSAQSM